MNNIALVFNDWHIQWYAHDDLLRGVSHNGERPVEAYVDDNVEDYTKFAIVTPCLKYVDTQPAEKRIKPMYVPLDKYIELNGKLIQVYESQITKELVYKSEGKEIVYDKILDSKLLDKEEAIDKYPEEFV